MTAFIGGLAGGLLVIYIASVLLEKFVVRHFTDSPRTGIPTASAIAAVVATVLYGFGNADGGAWNPFPGVIFYGIAAVLVTVLRLIGYNRRTALEEETAGVFD